MGIIDNKFQLAMNKGNRSTKKAAKDLEAQLTNFEGNIVDRLNWIMKTQQKIADKLEIELDDPLEE